MKRTFIMGFALLTVASAYAYSGYVHGKLYYNDMRRYGNFAWRQDMNGKHGTLGDANGERNDDSVNWLAALDVTARLYELDSLSKKLIDETHVLPDGGYVLHFADLSEADDKLEFGIEFEPVENEMS